MYGKLLEIYSEIGAATGQMIEEDDQVICNHVRTAKALLESLMKDVLKADKEEAFRLACEAVEKNVTAGQPRVPMSDKAESKLYEVQGLVADYRVAKNHD